MVGTPNGRNILPVFYLPMASLLKITLQAPFLNDKMMSDHNSSDLALVKDVRKRGNAKGRKQGNNNVKGKVINMVWKQGDNQKRKSRAAEEEGWMNTPITFSLIPADDVLYEPLIVEAEVKCYLVRRVFFDQGAAIPIGKIELEVAFGNEGLCRRTMMKFTVVRASSPYNIILGRTKMRDLRAVSSTIHAMMKFPTLKAKKVDDTWRMYIDFKDINLACPKDYYPLLEIDLEIESMMGFTSNVS
ncbi:hypothetical protein Tco_0731530 [Tanacetum coccineum]